MLTTAAVGLSHLRVRVRARVNIYSSRVYSSALVKCVLLILYFCIIPPLSSLVKTYDFYKLVVFESLDVSTVDTVRTIVLLLSMRAFEPVFPFLFHLQDIYLFYVRPEICLLCCRVHRVKFSSGRLSY